MCWNNWSFFFQSFVGSKEASNNPRDDPVVLEEKDCKPSSDDDTVHKLKEEAQSQRQIKIFFYSSHERLLQCWIMNPNLACEALFKNRK